MINDDLFLAYKIVQSTIPIASGVRANVIEGGVLRETFCGKEIFYKLCSEIYRGKFVIKSVENKEKI